MAYHAEWELLILKCHADRSADEVQQHGQWGWGIYIHCNRDHDEAEICTFA